MSPAWLPLPFRKALRADWRGLKMIQSRHAKPHCVWLQLGPSLPTHAALAPRSLPASLETFNRHPDQSQAASVQVLPLTRSSPHPEYGHSPQKCPECPHLRSAHFVASGVAQRDPHNCGLHRRPFRTIIQLSPVLDHEQIALTQPKCLPAARRARAQPNRSRPYHTTPIPRHLRSHQVVPNGVHGHITSSLLRKDLYHLVRCLWMTSTIPQDLNRSGQETGTMNLRLTPQSSSGMKKMKRLKRRKSPAASAAIKNIRVFLALVEKRPR